MSPKKCVGELVETAVFEVDREIDDETLPAVAKNPESSIMRADGAGSGRAGNQAEAMATSAMAKNGPLIFSEEKKRKETGNTQLLEAPALEAGLIRWKYVFKGFVTDLITDGCKQLKSAKERELLRAGTGKANDKKELVKVAVKVVLQGWFIVPARGIKISNAGGRRREVEYNLLEDNYTAHTRRPMAVLSLTAIAELEPLRNLMRQLQADLERTNESFMAETDEFKLKVQQTAASVETLQD